MNKKLIALAVAASVAAPIVASADVSVYGVAQMELYSKKLGSTTTTNMGDDYGQSRVGVKWSEDLGGGLAAVGLIELGPNAYKGSTANNTTGLYTRNAHLGLKGSFGQVVFGTTLQPYKYAGGVKYDAFVATAAQARGTGGMLGTAFGQNGYFGNSIAYTGKFGNTKVAVSTSLAENTEAAQYRGHKGDLMAAVTVGLGKGAEVGVAYANDKYNAVSATSGTSGQTNSKVFGKYTMGPHQILAQYENHTGNGAGADSKVMFLGYRFTMGMNKFVVQLGNTDVKGGSTADVKYAAIGAIHNMSKKTSAFVAYRKTDKNGSTNDETITTVGMKTKF